MQKGLIFLLLFLSFIAANAQQPFTRNVWLNESNTPVKVNDLVEDDHGYMWLGTDAGVYRFNGRAMRFVPDTVRKPVTALATAGGTVYAGYNEGGIGMVLNDTIQQLKIDNGISSAITSLHAIGNSTLFATTDEQGIAAVMGSKVAFFDAGTKLPDNFVYQLSTLSPARMLAGTDRGIADIQLRNNKVIVDNITTLNGLPDNIVRVIKHRHGEDICWLGTQQGGIALYNIKDKTVRQPHLKEQWKWGQVNDILLMSATRAWVATEAGYLLNISLTGNDSAAVEEVALEGKRINKLHCGRSGILWCATDDGLTMVTSEYMVYLSLGTHFDINTLRAMTCDVNNVFWFAQANKLYRYNMYKENAASAQVCTLPVDITSLFADNRNRMWIGTAGAGLWYLNEAGGLTQITGIHPLQNESILDVNGTADRLWVSGLNGVEELSYPNGSSKPQLIRHHDKRSGIGSDYVYQLYPDSKGKIWMATDGGGISMYQNGKYETWDTAAGMISKVVYTIAEDAEGNIWAATLDHGLLRYDGEKWKQFGKLQGLQDINISTIAGNNTGQMVAVHSQGIDVWYPNSNQFRNYSKKQALGIDSVSGVLKLYARDALGNVYVPFQDGVIVFKNISPHYDIRPAINISSVNAVFQQVPLGTGDFDYDENNIGFKYEGVNFANPERLHYRYKLEGYNNNWTITNDESVTFPQLPSGKYLFRVQASLNTTFNTAEEAVYSFTIEKPLWKQLWFIAAALVLVIAIGYTYVKTRERNIKKLSLLQRERMMFEYEHLKSQVNPHFLFNSLNTLTSLIDENADSAMVYTSRLSDLYRNMLSYRDHDLIQLSEEWEILDNYMYIQQTRFGNALRLNVDVPPELMEQKRIVPLALQLLVENAIKHNVVSKAKPLIITIKVTNDFITVSNPIQTKLSKEKGAGLGLINIRKRYALLSNKNIYFGIQNDEYVVIMPLL